MQGQNMSTRIDYSKASPEAFKAFGGVHVALQNGDLSKMLIDLVFLRVSQINGCAYCIDLHSRDLLKLGREQAALAWAESVTRVEQTGVPQADYDAVTAEFNDKELAELTYAISLMNAYNRLGVAFRMVPTAAKG